jgi:glycosyltransferase involved in cell wall biosynthesis
MVIVSPLFPPARGGLADHTAQLARELAKETTVSVVTSAGAGVGETGSVHPVIGNWRDAAALVAALGKISPTALVLWQYVPHMYGRGGVNPALSRAMIALRRTGRRQMVIAHEIAAPFSAWPHRCWYALAQRRQWREILSCADGVGISTEAWLEDWTRRIPENRRKFFLLPSPSSITVTPVLQGHAQRWRQAHGLSATTRVLIYFGSLCAAKQFPWIVAAWKQAQNADHPVALVVIGDQPHLNVPGELAALFKPVGYLAAPDVSAALQAADALALPFVDGVSERRTTFMAGLSHGCAIVTTVGQNTGPTLRRAPFFKAAPAVDCALFARLVTQTLAESAGRKCLGEAAKAAYAQAYDWPVVVRSVCQQSRGIHLVEGGT